MFPFAELTVYTMLAQAANTATQSSQVCTLEWLGATLGFPCEHLPLFAAAVVAMAVLGVVIVWAVKRTLDDASEITVTLKRPRKA